VIKIKKLLNTGRFLRSMAIDDGLVNILENMQNYRSMRWGVLGSVTGAFLGAWYGNHELLNSTIDWSLSGGLSPEQSLISTTGGMVFYIGLLGTAAAGVLGGISAWIGDIYDSKPQQESHSNDPRDI